MADIVVIGAGGHIGYELCLSLVEQGHLVMALDFAFPPGVSGDMPDKPDNFLIELADFSDAMAMQEWLDKAQIVFHLGSTHLQVYAEDLPQWNADAASVKLLVDFAANRGVERFIHVSSTAVYGDLAGKRANEETAANPKTPWAQSELDAEQEVVSFGQSSDFPYTVLRPSWVFGGHCPRTRKLVDALNTGKLISLGGGENLRQPLYVKDMVKALNLAMTSDAAAGQTFVVAGPRPTKARDILRSLSSAARTPQPKFNAPAALGGVLKGVVGGLSGVFKMEPPISPATMEFFQINESFDTSKAKDVLGFEAEVSFRDGIKECRDALTGR